MPFLINIHCCAISMWLLYHIMLLQTSISAEDCSDRTRLLSEKIEVDITEIRPLVEFLRAWLEVVKDREWTYNYLDTGDALLSLFLAAPFLDHFNELCVLEVHTHLTDLFTTFASLDVVTRQETQIHEQSKQHVPVYAEDIHEIHWILTRPNVIKNNTNSGCHKNYNANDSMSPLLYWDITWSFMNRARLRPIGDAALSAVEWRGAMPLFDCTQIKAGAIVYRTPSMTNDAEAGKGTCTYLDDWKQCRRQTYKVEEVDHVKGSVTVQKFVFFNVQYEDFALGQSAPVLYPYVATAAASISSNDKELGLANDSCFDMNRETFSLSDVKLLEQNRGKAGAMNVYADYIRAVGTQWMAKNNIPDRERVQLFEGIVDARHMLAEPDIFWNEALPYFSADKQSLEPTKQFGGSRGSSSRRAADKELRLGKNERKHPVCFLVQYPQCFTNVNHKDYLDNTNGAYYTLWQCLRDSGKVATSSGSNAIWDITCSSFQFATTSRIEDTGTSHDYMHESTSVSMPCFVAYGIAKKTEDYLEAVYRWSAGAVELFWGAIFSRKIVHFMVIAVATTFFACACFVESSYWFYIWLGLLLAVGFKGLIDKGRGQKPLRHFLVSSVIVTNTTNWMGNMLSFTWTLLVPIYIAITLRLPLASNNDRAVFWFLAGVFLRLPQAIMSDRLIRICRTVNPITESWNFNMTLWRSSQLYACSFGYTILSLFAGTASAYRAYFLDHDLTMWTSFRVSNVAMQKAWSECYESKDFQKFLSSSGNLVLMILKSAMAAARMPDVLTKWYSLSIFVTQCICILAAGVFADDTSIIVVMFIVCALNICLVIDISMLMSPGLAAIIGQPARPEYILGFLSTILIIVYFGTGQMGAAHVSKVLHIG